MELFVPGRLCLFGEHSDWAGAYNRINAAIPPGLAVVAGIGLGIHATAKRSQTFRYRTAGASSAWMEYPLSTTLLRKEAERGGFYSYVAGTAAYMLENYHVGGISVDCHRVTLPMKKGLSSSAAVCVAIARAFNQLYALHLTTRGEMEAAYRGEILTPSRCGRLDQACAFGEGPVMMEFCGDDIHVTPIKVGEDLYWVIAYLNGKKDTKRILASLNACYPFARGTKEQNIHRALGVENQRIVRSVIEAVQEGDSARIGCLMREAQFIFDTLVAPTCPEELEAPALHALMRDPAVQSLSLGIKGVGSQGDGCAQMICPDAQSQANLIERLRKLGYDAIPFTLRAKDTHAILPPKERENKGIDEYSIQ